jgi:hypothetical protein
LTYSDFAARWLKSGGAEHANYGLFLPFLCDLLGVALPENQQPAASSGKPEIQPWPTELAQQMQAVRAVVQQAAVPLKATVVTARFWGATAKKVQPLLETLANLALLRVVEEENAYAA